MKEKEIDARVQTFLTKMQGRWYDMNVPEADGAAMAGPAITINTWKTFPASAAGFSAKAAAASPSASKKSEWKRTSVFFFQQNYGREKRAGEFSKDETGWNEQRTSIGKSSPGSIKSSRWP
ncbi:MAG: hypothetical protein WBC70_05410 [Candidatus Aminicenantales bacterium]